MSSLNQNIIRHKIGLLNLAAELGNVSKACKMLSLSRDTFYRYHNAVTEGGVEALFDANRKKPNLKNRADPSIEAAVIAYATEQPAHGQVRVSNQLRERGIFISPSGVSSIWLRNDLASFQQRLSALEKHVAEEAIILTDAQIAALEKNLIHQISRLENTQGLLFLPMLFVFNRQGQKQGDGRKKRIFLGLTDVIHIIDFIVISFPCSTIPVLIGIGRVNIGSDTFIFRIDRHNPHWIIRTGSMEGLHERSNFIAI